MRTDADRRTAALGEQRRRRRMNRDLEAIRAARPVLASWETVRLRELLAAAERVMQ